MSTRTIRIGEPITERNEVGLFTLAFAILAGPLAWGLALYSLYAVASHTCYPGSTPRASALWHAGGILWGIAAVAFALCVIAALVSYRSWRASAGGGSERPYSVVEGRTRFLAMWGTLTGTLFAILMLVSLFPLLVMPLCG
jgi:hypothetical protein